METTFERAARRKYGAAKKKVGMEISSILIRARQKGDVLNVHESFVEVRDELLDYIMESVVYPLTPNLSSPDPIRQLVKTSKEMEGLTLLERAPYITKHKTKKPFGILAGTLLINRGFDSRQEAQAWGEWNYKGHGNWAVVETARSNASSLTKPSHTLI